MLRDYFSSQTPTGIYAPPQTSPVAAAALLETVDTTLSPSHSQECDGQQAITHEELEEALKLMPRGKRPGNDGLP